MGWAVGGPYNGRWVGYGVPTFCEHPDCEKEIDRGLSWACGGGPISDWPNCGMYFCDEHRGFRHPQDPEVLDEFHEYDPNIDYPPYVCERCANGEEPFEFKPEHPDWVKHVLTDESWAKWREEEPGQVEFLRNQLVE